MGCLALSLAEQRAQSCSSKQQTTRACLPLPTTPQTQFFFLVGVIFSASWSCRVLLNPLPGSPWSQRLQLAEEASSALSVTGTRHLSGVIHLRSIKHFLSHALVSVADDLFVPRHPHSLHAFSDDKYLGKSVFCETLDM